MKTFGVKVTLNRFLEESAKVIPLSSSLRLLLIWFRIIQKPDFITTRVSEHPIESEIKPGQMYVVGGREYQKWAYFLCPSETGEIVKLSLQRNRRPHWQVTIDFLGRPTIHPSIRQLEGLYAHFWISRGAVHWCADTGKESVWEL